MRKYKDNYVELMEKGVEDLKAKGKEPGFALLSADVYKSMLGDYTPKNTYPNPRGLKSISSVVLKDGVKLDIFINPIGEGMIHVMESSSDKILESIENSHKNFELESPFAVIPGLVFAESLKGDDDFVDYEFHGRIRVNEDFKADRKTLGTIEDLVCLEMKNGILWMEGKIDSLEKGDRKFGDNAAITTREIAAMPQYGADAKFVLIRPLKS